MLDVCIPYAFRPVATRIAKANARSSCCHYCVFVLCSSEVDVVKVQAAPKKHLNLKVSVLPPGLQSTRVNPTDLHFVLAAQL